MKPFDLNLAKAGHPVCTRDGRPARIICFDRISKNFPIVGLIKTGCEEETHIFTDKGKYISDGKETDLDLFMSPEKKEGWVNIYNRPDGKVTGHCIYSSEKEAKKNIFGRKDEYLATIKIEWEE